MHGVSARPYVQSISPLQGAVSVSTNAVIDISIVNGSAQVATNSIQLSLNGSPVSPSIASTGGIVRISYDPPCALPFLSSNVVTLVFTDTAVPAKTRTESFSFMVESSLPKACL